MNIKELANMVELNNVLRTAEMFYGPDLLFRVINNYKKITAADAKEVGITVFVRAMLRDSSGKLSTAEDFNENETSVIYDVWGEYDDDEDKTPHAVDDLDIEEIAGLKLNEDVLNNMSKTSALAHILFSITK
ncbi:MAG: hypothetical protein E7411_00840 [Ruminococcaceae bacterium]|nr:hypothetical protein [Oscillospiraceae bacterium]